MEIVWDCSSATFTTIACFQSSKASLHHKSMWLLLLIVVASHVSAFSPCFGSTPSFRSNFIAGSYVDVVNHVPSSICASGDDTVNNSSNEEDEDDGDDDEVDIITQRLRRNAETVPINPIKEHDKMVQENEDEARFVSMGINGDTAGAPSTLYSHILANAIDPDFDPDTSTDEAYIESQFRELLSRKGDTLSSGTGHCPFTAQCVFQRS
ncbi:hypothetical protein ACHAXA_005767 [Cyclostephanos tholiformis]|uniref:Uncharacterized protein n=1 Tax=Cyclostephanos tholiformis TaxID=382380 RepID=A0ABD3RSJ8_9STRA